MKVIYATSDLEAWIKVAKNMQKKLSWEPIYWITSPKNESMVVSAFPFIISQGAIDAVRGIYSQIDSLEPTVVLDESIIKQYLVYEKVALKMMDRMDPNAHSFNLSERTELYYELLSYWVHKILILKPDIVVFSESPHSLFSYMLYAVCMENSIKIVRFVPTYIGGLTFLSSSLDEIPKYLQDMYYSYERIEIKNKDYPIASEYLEKNRGDYKDAVPYYMQNITKKHNLKENIFLYLAKAKRFILNPTFIAYKRGPSYGLSSKFTKFDLLLYRIYGYRVKINLKKRYNSFCETVNLSKPYIYVALHYQPEKTTSPEGGIFVDQMLMISMLSNMVDKDCKIYVKEHTSQFSSQFFGEQGRHSSFYEKLSKFKNVQLVQSHISSFDLIDQAKAVATVTGTVGLEAVIRGKVVLSFGHAWYKICHGVMDIKNRQDLKQSLKMINDGFEIKEKRVDAFLYAIEKISFPCYINQGNKASVSSISDAENIDNLINCLINYVDQV